MESDSRRTLDVLLRPDSFGSLADNRSEVTLGASEDNNSVLGSDGADELGSMPGYG